MRDLAERLLPVYQEADPDRYLANLSVLQMAAGDYAAADESRESLRERRRRADPAGRSAAADAATSTPTPRSSRRESHRPIRRGVREGLRGGVFPAERSRCLMLSGWLSAAPQEAQDDFQRLLDEQRPKDSIDEQGSREAAVGVSRTSRRIGRSAPSVGALDAEDDARRYAEERDAASRCRGRGDSSRAVVIAPEGRHRPRLPALLELGIDRPDDFAKECAAHGYVGVFADVAAQRRRTPFVPYQHDGEEARAVIVWIAKQPWSDGRVAMYGEGYSGFTAWAAAARPPPALKAIATSEPTAPGHRCAHGRRHLSEFRVSMVAAGHQHRSRRSIRASATMRRMARARREMVSERAALSGSRAHLRQAQPDLHPLAESPELRPVLADDDPVSGEQFARIDIPVLTTTGYFAEGRARGALLFFAASSLQSARRPHPADRSL